LRRHPDEVARFLDGRSAGDLSSLIALAPAPVAAAILEQLNPRVAAEAIGGLELEQARALVTAMSPSRAAPIVVSMAEHQRDALLMRLDPGITKEIREQLSFPAESAGALMDARISAFSAEMTVDDALRKMRTFKEKRDINNIYIQDANGRLVGAGKDEKALSPILFSVRQRLPWLEINLATAFLAATVVGLFEDTIARFTALAVLLPVVAGQSGNAGMQALGVTVRGLALRE